MLCSISGEIPTEPVVSPKSGAVFDKKHIVNFISINGTDPVNDQPLTVDELIAIKTAAPEIVLPKPPQFTSIPSLLSTFQNEWDAIALEVFTLRKLLLKAREELSVALYHHDAAVRVAANSIRERDEAKQALQDLAISLGRDDLTTKTEETHQTEKHEQDDDKIEVDSEVENKIPVEEIKKAQEVLFQIHKSQKPTLSVKPDQTIEIKFNESVVHPFKLLENSFVSSSSKKVLLASKTKLIKYDYITKQTETIKRKKPIITGLNYIEAESDLVSIIAYKDKVFINEEPFQSSLKSIYQIIFHPKLLDLFLLISPEGWSINNIEKGELFVAELHGIVTGGLHVDGGIVAISTENEVKIFQLIDGKEVTRFESKEVNKLTFGLNGYWLFAASSKGVEVFDLRKMVKVHTIEVDGLVDFIVDPSSSIVVTYEKEKFRLHRYMKKGKQWFNNAAELEVKKNIVSINFLNDENDENFKTSDELKIIAIADNSAVLEYQLEYE